MNWRRLLGTAAVAGATALSPMKAHGGSTTAQWDQALNKAWQELNPKQRQELRQEELQWIKWRDSLSSDDDRRGATKSRTWYIMWIKDPKGVTAPDPTSDEEKALERVGMALVQQQQENEPAPESEATSDVGAQPTPASTPAATFSLDRSNVTLHTGDVYHQMSAAEKRGWQQKIAEYYNDPGGPPIEADFQKGQKTAE
jgi:Lysozyme inhibitor LprI